MEQSNCVLKKFELEMEYLDRIQKKYIVKVIKSFLKLKKDFRELKDAELHT